MKIDVVRRDQQRKRRRKRRILEAIMIFCVIAVMSIAACILYLLRTNTL